MRSSTAWRSRFSDSSSSASRRASASSYVSRRSSAAPGCPSRPAALIRGASRNATEPVSTVAGSTPADAHERLEARLVGSREPSHAGRDEAAVLVEEGTTSATVARATRSRCRSRPSTPSASRSFRRLPSRKARERVIRRPRRYDGALRQGLARSMVIGDDHLQPRSACLGDLLDRGDAAVDGEDKGTPFLPKAGQRVPRDPVALFEAARKVPLDVGAELAQRAYREGGGADPVRVVVAVDADAPAGGDRLADERAGGLDVAEPERVVPGGSAARKARAVVGVAVSPPDEDGCRRVADAERRGRASVPRCGGTDASSRCPRASRSTVGRGIGRTGSSGGLGRPRLSSGTG